MKSKILGASLALALVAVGFTGCYDSANENVVVPGQTTPVAAKYVVYGYVSDYLTDAAIDGATVSGAGVNQTTANGGFYSQELSSPVDGKITISKDETEDEVAYQDVERYLKMFKAETGTVSYEVSAALMKEGWINGVIVDVDEANFLDEANKKVITLAEPIVNEDDEVISAEVTLEVPYGAISLDEEEVATKAYTAADFHAYLKALYGKAMEVGTKYTTAKRTFVIDVPARSKVETVTVTPLLNTETYFLPDTPNPFSVRRVAGHLVVPNVISLDHNGHNGHNGHDSHGSNNAGGGTTDMGAA